MKFKVGDVVRILIPHLHTSLPVGRIKETRDYSDHVYYWVVRQSPESVGGWAGGWFGENEIELSLLDMMVEP